MCMSSYMHVDVSQRTKCIDTGSEEWVHVCQMLMEEREEKRGATVQTPDSQVKISESYSVRQTATASQAEISGFPPVCMCVKFCVCV